MQEMVRRALTNIPTDECTQVRSMLNYSSFDRFSPKAVKMADILKEYVVNGLKSWPNLAQFSLDRFQKKYNLGSTITVSIYDLSCQFILP